MNKKTGVLLVNLGTPATATLPAVRAYLREFLSDPRVIDLPWIFRMLLLHGIILPFRTRLATAAYQKIWTAEGSPLLVHSRNFAEQLQTELGEAYQVLLAMRYGTPSMEEACQILKTGGCEQYKKWVVIPLFPQYATATTGSVLAKFHRLIARCQVPYHSVSFFYNNPYYLESMTQRIQETMRGSSAENTESVFILFSYHGLPQRQLVCEEEGRMCYRAHCFATTAALVQSLGLDENQYMTAFQSRLGGARWIQPYTDQVLEALIARDIRRIIVVCPSFVVDCLETLEEIHMRLRAQWLGLGGERMVIVPCLNSESYWVRAMANMVRVF